MLRFAPNQQRARLIELERAQAQADLIRQRQAEIAAQFQGDGDKPAAPRPQPQPTQAQKDYVQWVEMMNRTRPGLNENSPEVVTAMRELHADGYQYGMPAWRREVERRVPAADYGQQQQRPAQPPAMASEGGAVKQEPQQRPERDPSRTFVSAPVSRMDGPSYSGARVPSASSVRLSPEQREICRATGVSELDYAKNLIRMREMQKAGLLQDGR